MNLNKIALILLLLTPVINYATDATSEKKGDPMDIDTEEVTSDLQELTIDDNMAEVLELISDFEADKEDSVKDALIKMYRATNNTIIKTMIQKALKKSGIYISPEPRAAFRRLFN